jgi:hypothetical protein
MALLRCGNVLRLSGAEAKAYLSDTGRKTLPKTIEEYNAAMQEMRNLWEKYDTPETKLLAAVCFKSLDPLP